MIYLEFEKSLAEIEKRVEDLRALGKTEDAPDVESETSALSEKAAKMLGDLYKDLTPWRKCQVARHPERPHAVDYIDRILDEFCEFSGDRCFANDKAVIGGLGRLNGRTVVVVAHEKGSDTTSRLERNFGMACPEGYRKAGRLMDLAHRFNLPFISLIDTPGAYPGKGAEERGQSEAIARSTEKMLQIKVPVVSIIIGEGGSGGALAFAVANRVAMLEHSIYSVISPEGCASILWKDSQKMREAAIALRLTAQDLKTLDVIDRIIDEPTGGAHRDPVFVIDKVKQALGEMLGELLEFSPEKLLADRREKFLKMGSHGI